MATSNFTYGAGNPTGVPTVAKPVPTAPAPKPVPTPSKTTPPKVAPTVPVVPVVSTGLTPAEIAAQILAAQNAANAANAAELAKQQAAADVAAKMRAGQSAYDLLFSEFDRYGLGSLLEDVKGLIVTGADPAQLTLALRQTKAYQNRFAANKDRIANGLRALSEAEYITLEDQYQNVMRNYGLPASYYTKDATGKQAGFEKFIAGDVSAAELEDRISIAQKRVIDAAPQVKEALKQFYPDIKDGDILAYTLDPTQGLANIQKKVLAAEIGGAALGAKTASGAALATSASRAEELARYGVTAESAKQGYGAIGSGLERGRQLSSVYQQPDYTQAVAEEEIFNLPGQTEAQQKRKKVIGLEKATFGGQTGVSSGALSQNRAGSY